MARVSQDTTTTAVGTSATEPNRPKHTTYASSLRNKQIERKPNVLVHRFTALQPDFSGRVLVGKGEKPRLLLDLKRELNEIWKVEKEWQLIPMGKSFYTIKFATAEDTAAAQTNTAWDLSFGTIRLRQWVRFFDPYMEISSLCEVWMRIYHLPLEFWTLDVITGIGRALGTPIRVDGASTHGAMGNYARILLEIDLSRPLPETLLVDGDERSFYVEFDFEQIPAYCTKCKITGHSIDKCNKIKQKGNNKEGEAQQNLVTKGKEIYHHGTTKAPMNKNWTQKLGGGRNKAVEHTKIPIRMENSFAALEHEEEANEIIQTPNVVEEEEREKETSVQENSQIFEGERVLSGPDILQLITVPITEVDQETAEDNLETAEENMQDEDMDGKNNNQLNEVEEVDLDEGKSAASLYRESGASEVQEAIDKQQQKLESAIKARQIIETVQQHD
ncbi:uncharacterized protein LOC131008250 [Salvia miltiorrhiza]|uniref:uncharacterized protein LOC131008250 n=1 Tax=Salvia miltiorrhiza TaxID=226208 RepID=UPI0025AD874A|nr:uncharacterized protein LOC131008250 [Salvia miltiorrhiza]